MYQRITGFHPPPLLAFATPAANRYVHVPVSGLGQVGVVTVHPGEEVYGCGALIAACGEVGIGVSEIVLHGANEQRCREHLMATVTLGQRFPNVTTLDQGDEDVTADDFVRLRNIEMGLQAAFERRRIDSLFLPDLRAQGHAAAMMTRLIYRAAARVGVPNHFCYSVLPAVDAAADLIAVQLHAPPALNRKVAALGCLQEDAAAVQQRGTVASLLEIERYGYIPGDAPWWSQAR